MYCPDCGSPNPDNSSYCTACGAKLTVSPLSGPSVRHSNASIAAPTETDNTVRIDPIADDPTVMLPPPPPATPGPASSPGITFNNLPTAVKSNRTPVIIAIVLAIVLVGLLAVIFLRKPSRAVEEAPVIADDTVESTEITAPTVDGNYPGDTSNPDTRFQSFDWLSERNVTMADLAGLSPGDLRLLRNAIFAMHGYRFKSADLQEYFGRFQWYSPDYADVTSRLSQIERDNIATIKKHEGKSSSASTPSTPSSSSSNKSRLRNVSYANDYSDIVCYVYLDRSDLAGLSSTDLRILRNTIYARHGRRFKDESLQRYFNGMPWYSPTCNEVSPSALSDVERHNISLIQSLE